MGTHEPAKERPTPVVFAKHLLSNSRVERFYRNNLMDVSKTIHEC